MYTKALVSNIKRFIMINDVSIPGDSGYQVQFKKELFNNWYVNFICEIYLKPFLIQVIMPFTGYVLLMMVELMPLTVQELFY